MKKTSCLRAKMCNYVSFVTSLIIDRQAHAALMHLIDIKQRVTTHHILIWLLWMKVIGKTKKGLVALLSSVLTKAVWSVYLKQIVWLPSAFISRAHLHLWLISRSSTPLKSDWAARGVNKERRLTSLDASIWGQCYLKLASVNNVNKRAVLSPLYPAS